MPRRPQIHLVGKLGTLGFVVATLFVAGGADDRHPALVWTETQATQLSRQLAAFYRRTPADERVTWGGLAAATLLAVGVTLERTIRIRTSKIIPASYTGRFHERLVAGKLDRGKALDYCELNPSPASRVVLAAVRRWGRPVSDLERGVALARGIEVDRLKRHVGTLRRIAVLAPMIGLLGSLLAANRGLSAGGAAWAPVVAGSLATLTVGVGLAILCLVAYDGLAGRVEFLSNTLDRLGAEAVDAIALAAQTTVNKPPAKPAFEKTPAVKGKFRRESANHSPSPHASRAEIPLEDAE